MSFEAMNFKGTFCRYQRVPTLFFPSIKTQPDMLKRD